MKTKIILAAALACFLAAPLRAQNFTPPAASYAPIMQNITPGHQGEVVGGPYNFGANTTMHFDSLTVSVAFSDLTSTPTTLAGYGITDAQPLNSNLTALAGLASGSFGRTLLGETSAANARTDLGLVIGTNVQAYNSNLTTFAGITAGAFGQTLISEANASNARSDLGLVIGTNVQAYSGNLATLAGITPGTFGQTLLAEASASSTRTDLSLVIGTNVQAYNSNLTTFAGISPTSAMQTFLGSASNSTAQTNLGASTVGKNIFSATNPGAITFLQINADNTVTFNSASAQRTALGLVIGTNVQAYSGNLATLAGITPGAFGQTLLAEASASSTRTDLGLVIGTNVQAYSGNLASFAGVTPTTVGLSFTSTANPSAITFARINADNTVSFLSAASFLSAIGGQAANSNLTTLAGLASTTLGQNLLTLANPSAITFLRINADNTATARSAANFRSDLSLVVGTDVQVYSAALTALSANLNSSGNIFTGNFALTLNGGGASPGNSLTVQNLSAAALGAQQQVMLLNAIAQGWNNSSNASKQVEWKIVEEPVQGNPVLTVLNIYARSADISSNAFKSVMKISMKNGFAELVSGDDYSLTWNGSTVGIGKGGTGAVTAGGALTALGGTTVGVNLFTLSNPSAITFIRINADNTATARSAANFRGDLGLGSLALLNSLSFSDLGGALAITEIPGMIGASRSTGRVVYLTDASNEGTTNEGTEGQVLTWRSGIPVFDDAPGGGGGGSGGNNVSFDTDGGAPSVSIHGNSSSYAALKITVDGDDNKVIEIQGDFNSGGISDAGLNFSGSYATFSLGGEGISYDGGPNFKVVDFDGTTVHCVINGTDYYFDVRGSP